MNQEKINIDNLFKERLEGYSGVPSDKVWEQIETTLQKQGMFHGFIARNKKWAAALLLLIISAGAFLVWSISSEYSNSPSQNIVAVEEPAIIIDNQQDIVITQSSFENIASDPNIVKLSESSRKSDHIISADHSTESERQSDHSVSDDHSISADESNESIANIVEVAQLQESALPLQETVITKSEPLKLVAPEETTYTGTISQTEENSVLNESYRLNVFTAAMLNPDLVPGLLTYDLNDQDFFHNVKTETGIKQISDFTPWERMASKPSYLCLGVSAGPEYIFYSKEKRNTAFSYGVDIYYNKSGFVARTGVFLSRYGDQGEYTLNYQRIDSLGYMYSVESFTVDPNNPDSVIFNMKIEGVYDSINVVENKFTDAWYSYLQVPVLFGYTYSRFGNLTLDFTAGPVFNLLVNQRTQRPDLPQGDNVYINDVQEQTTPWLRTNWQLMASISMHYRLSNHIRINVEPIYRYYVHPVYTGNTSTDASPYSLGGKVGLLYKF